MPDPITEEAIRIIDAAPVRGPVRPADYAKALPPEAGALARVLSSKAVLEEAERYRIADKGAIRAQRSHLWLPRSALIAVYASVVLGGVGVYLSTATDASLVDAVRPYLTVAQALFMGISCVCLIALSLLAAPRRRWLEARARAEWHRWSLFRLIMSGSSKPSGTEVELLPLQLECFRRHLVDDQRRFFDARVQRHRRAARVGKVLGVVALVLIGLASLPQLAASLSSLGAFDWMPDAVHSFIASLVTDKKLYALAWLYGISLQLLITRLAFISPVARHVERYEVMRGLLSQTSRRLAEARDAAVAASHVPVEWFTRSVLDILETEHQMWLVREEQATPARK